LSKERILELYFNAIEFGPRLYGIGPAARHYFGKTPSELVPMEAAFFSSILPSPKKRYVQYCHGTPTAQWERYVRRILSKMRERGRLNDEEFATATASTLVFDKAEMTMTEKQCTDWVRRITARPEPEPELEADAQ
jgi:penicillin-binding protein 1A